MERNVRPAMSIIQSSFRMKGNFVLNVGRKELSYLSIATKFRQQILVIAFDTGAGFAPSIIRRQKLRYCSASENEYFGGLSSVY